MEIPGTMMAGSVRDRSNGGGPRRVPVPVWAAKAAAACWAALKKKLKVSTIYGGYYVLLKIKKVF